MRREEAARSAPVVVTKATTTVAGQGAAVQAPLYPTAPVDCEGAPGVAIGPRAVRMPAGRAMEHMVGDVVVDDVTSRELQKRHDQWVIGKGIDRFWPMGAWLVIADEAGDPAETTHETPINGELGQQPSVADLIFDILTLIETRSRTMRLQPCDIIATGMPDGVGVGANPPRHLTPGDRKAVSITGLGTLEDSLVRAQRRADQPTSKRSRPARLPS